VLDEVDRMRPRRPEELGPPVRVVVPSASLRHHLLRRLVGGGTSLVGVQVQTLHGAACEVLERAGDRAVSGEATFEVLVRRHAGAEPDLRHELDGLQDGYAVVAAAVRDLLDAGFEPVHSEAIEDKLDDLQGRVAPHRLRRVAALVRVASSVSDELLTLDALRPAQVPQRAAELLRRGGSATLPSRAVLVHGFADATGVATDFIHTLLITCGGALALDRPPDPAEPVRDDAGAVFLERFQLHFTGLEQAAVTIGPSRAELDAFEAPTAEAEVRQLAHRVRTLLDAGAVPESIAVVAREVTPLANALRRHLDRLGVPHSGAGASVPGGAVWRRARLLAAVLRSGAEVPAELWLEALEDTASRTDLMLALRTLGVVRTAEAAVLRWGGGSGVPLPLPEPQEDGEPAEPRVVPASEVDRLKARAGELVAAFEGWPERADAAGHLDRALGVVRSLAWAIDSTATREVRSALEQLAADLPTGWPLARGEFSDRAVRQLEALGNDPIGGAGGGVQLLSAMEARARTFDHLFLLGLNRGVFPRVVHEDALLPDAVRGHLAAEVLPEFPVKARGLDEERYLFAQLLASAPRVTLSWRTSKDGNKVAVSPFVERLRRSGQLAVEESAPDAASPRPRSAFDHAVAAARPATRDSLAPVLAEALEEGRRRAAMSAQPEEGWALARLEILDYIDPLRARTGPGPWAGLVGEVARPGDDPPPVTGLEAVARCPLQTLLVRRLGLSPMPDPRHGLPDTRGALVGELVHAVLQRIVDSSLDRRERTLDEALRLEPQPVAWPDSDTVDRIVANAASWIAHRHGLDALGMAPLLAAQARPYLEVAAAVEWGDDGLIGVLAAEVSSQLPLRGLDRPLRFRADRVDLGAAGPRLVDYKTGRPPWGGVKSETRRKHLMNDVVRGRALQGVAYALAAGEGGCGRYLHLAPDIGKLPDQARDVRIEAEETDAEAAFQEAVTIVAEAWRVGALPPRVEEPDGKDPAQCGYCPVSAACLRDDSGYRRRLAEWMQRSDESESPLVRAARALWWLGVERPGEAQ
jgi:hypothetical protein